MALSKRDIKAELLRMGRDPAYFINNYSKITHPIEGLIPFKLYNFQKEAVKNFQDYRFNIILKARQLGLSTTVAAYVCWLMVFHREKNILVVATKQQTATNLVRKVKAIHKYLPRWVRQVATITVDNRTSFELSNGSQVKAASTSGDAGRSEALSLLVVDEAALIEGMDELWAGLYPTLSTGGMCIALSTPYGVGNWFHKTYIESEEGKNDFYSMKLPWDVHPDRNDNWFEKETRNMSRREIAQELQCNFNASGETVIHPDDLKRLFEVISEPKYQTGFDRNYWIWEEPQQSVPYIVAADVARGDGTDYSVAHVFRLDTMEQVAEYQGKLTTDMFAPLLFSIGKEYNNALMIIENNSLGLAVLNKIEELEYPNIYYSARSTHEYIEANMIDVVDGIAGFTMSMKTRPLVIAKLEELIRNKIINVKSQRLVNELKTFIWKNGKPQGMRGYNDDLVMALCMVCWVRETALITNKRENEYKKALLGAMSVSKSKLDTRIQGMAGYRPSANKPTNYDKDLLSIGKIIKG
jgi:hypothetical protein